MHTKIPSSDIHSQRGRLWTRAANACGDQLPERGGQWYQTNSSNDSLWILRGDKSTEQGGLGCWQVLPSQSLTASGFLKQRSKRYYNRSKSVDLYFNIALLSK